MGNKQSHPKLEDVLNLLIGNEVSFMISSYRIPAEQFKVEYFGQDYQFERVGYFDEAGEIGPWLMQQLTDTYGALVEE